MIEFLFFYRKDLTDRHPVPTLICGAVVTVLLLWAGNEWTAV